MSPRSEIGVTVRRQIRWAKSEDSSESEYGWKRCSPAARNPSPSGSPSVSESNDEEAKRRCGQGYHALATTFATLPALLSLTSNDAVSITSFVESNFIYLAQRAGTPT